MGGERPEQLVPGLGGHACTVARERSSGKQDAPALARAGGPQVAVPIDEARRQFEVNVFGLARLTQLVTPTMRAQHSGRIVNISSSSTHSGQPYMSPYVAAKSAVNGLTKTLATEFAKENVRINAVAPGPIWTPLIPSTMPEEKVESFGSDTPLGRAGQPVEIAPIYVLLASDEASYITGEVYAATGGQGTG